MKNLYLTLSILCALTAILITGCLLAPMDCVDGSYDSEIAVVADFSGSYVSNTYDQSLLELISTKREKWKGYHYRFSSLGDVTINKVYDVSIPADCQYLQGNTRKRDELVKAFSANLELAVQNLLSEDQKRNGSSLLRPISTELNRLSQSPAKRKVMVVFSDMFEESAIFNSANSKQASEVVNNPERMRSLMEKHAPVGSLHGIDVFIVYLAPDKDASEFFLVLAGAYKRYLEEHGAKVSLGANLNLSDL